MHPRVLPFFGAATLFAGLLTVPAKGALASAPSPSSVPPGIEMQLLQGPADDANNPRAHLYIVDNLAPGTTISRQVAVSNGHSAPEHVLFYPDAATIQAGSFTPLPERSVNDLTTWMTMSPAQATIPAGQGVTVTVTITVPAGAASGERYAAALAELPPAGPADGISLVSRVGIRVYLSVSTGGAPPASFTISSLTAGRNQQGDPLVSAQVRNTGGRAVDLSGQLTLSAGPAGLSAGPFPVVLGTTLGIGDHESVTVLMNRQLPAGPWNAVIVMTSGLLTEQATGRLTFPDGTGTVGAPDPMATVHPRSFPAVPLGVGLLVLLAATGTFGITLARRRRRAPA